MRQNRLKSLPTTKLSLAIGFGVLVSPAIACAPVESIPFRGAAVPDWYEAHRIHAHSRISPLAYARYKKNAQRRAQKGKPAYPPRIQTWLEAYRKAGAGFKKLGAPAFTRHIKTQDEDPIWPSAVPVDAQGRPQLRQVKNQVQPMVTEAHAAGRKFLAYYWDVSDTRMFKLNPEWGCKTVNGAPAGHKAKGQYLDISSPFGDVVAQRLQELQRYGADGVYLDFRHYPPEGCYGTALESSFRQANPRLARRKRTFPTYQEALKQFQAKAMAKVMNEWSEQFRNDPNFAFIVSTTSLPTLVNPEMTADLARAGIPKTEYHVATRHGINLRLFRNHPDLLLNKPSDAVQMALGWNLLRTISGASPHVWINGVPTYEQLFSAVGAVVTHGGVANVDVDELNITAAVNRRGATPRDVLEKIFALDQQLGPLFEGAAPVRRVAVHFSETSRNKRSLRKRWIDVAGPVTEVFELLLDKQIPTAVIDDRILAEGDLSVYQHIISPTVSELSEQQQKNIDRHNVKLLSIEAPPAFNRTRRYRKALTPVFKDPAMTPVKIEALPEGYQAVLWSAPKKQKTLLSIISPSFSQVQTQTLAHPLSTQGIKSLPSTRSQPVSIEIDWQQLGYSNQTICATDGLTGQSLGRPRQRMKVDLKAQWHLLSFEPCS
ncbi:hypothetical protein C1752_01480 [Acaryochloris thomasi RCC1774]|uniref:Uncharacterized protein n=1 Tax=Acaryochloris thomasi RCC1774 TaxID=1764569 RepID=A0A2W1JL18_9CYAN|nr:hypothetical protein [Acaryochloris thomasi]PZD74093.1 hypothetical protein C1752_01480 [Acaryochloris thomasi RCC1774]